MESIRKFEDEIAKITQERGKPPSWDSILKIYDFEELVDKYNIYDLANTKSTLDKYVDDNRCKYYFPNNPARHFVDAFKDRVIDRKTILTKLFIGANRTQKTTALINHIINLIMKPQNQWFEHPLYKSFRKPSYGRIISDPTTVKEKLIPELKKWLPKGSYHIDRLRRDYDYKWTIKETGSQFTIMTYDQDIKEFESVELDWCAMSEPPRPDILEATKLRLSFGGILLMEFTPLTVSGWIYDKYVNTPVDTVSITYSTMEDNCKQHATGGLLDHSVIEQFKRECDPLEYDARILGKFTHLAGLKYPTFNRNKHIVEPFPYIHHIKNNKAIIVNVLDPHDRKPFSLGWYLVYVNEPYKCYTIKEYPEQPFEKIRYSDLSIGDYARIIKDVEDRIGAESYIRFIDPNYGNRHVRQMDTVPKSVKDELGDYGLYYYDVTDNLTIGHKKVQEALRNDCFYIFNGLYNHIYSMTHYRDMIIDPMTSREKVCEDGKDFADLVRYLMVSEAWLYNPALKNKQFEYQNKGAGHG